MKYIFRFTIALNYTENFQKLTQDDLSQVLRSAKFPYIDRYPEIIEYTKPCIDDLIKTIAKENLPEERVQIIKEHFEKMKIDFDADQLAQIWQNEKQKVISKTIKDCVQTGSKFGAIKWQVTNNISNRNSFKVQPSAAICIETPDDNYQFEVGKSKMKKILQAFGSAEQFLDSHF